MTCATGVKNSVEMGVHGVDHKPSKIPPWTSIVITSQTRKFTYQRMPRREYARTERPSFGEIYRGGPGTFPAVPDVGSDPTTSSAKPAASSAVPPVSVIVCTRNRGDDVVVAVRSIQRCKFRDFELLIIDQSDDEATQRALEPLCQADSRLLYVRMAVPGKPGALNKAFQLARGKYLVLTDDDCEVCEGWIDAFVEVFEANPRVGCVHGDVSAGPYDPAQGYIPVCRIERAHTISSLDDFLNPAGEDWDNFGIGASMALRAEVVAAIGGCDPCIGPGAKFRTGDDTDIGVQVLRLGYAMHFSPAASVVHHGFRYWSSSRADIGRSGFAQGAIFIKHLRCGTLFRGSVFGVLDNLGTIAKRAVRGERPLGVTFAVNWARGALAGLTHRVDRRSNQFVTLADAEARSFSHHVGQVVTSERRSSRTPTPRHESVGVSRGPIA
jgi:GT2 family glycosyltransferase